MSLAYTIHDMPEEERPRERLHAFGAEALSTAELLAIVLGNGTRGQSVVQLAQSLLAKFGSLETLATATLAELCQVKGIGKAKALELQAVFNIGRRLQNKEARISKRIDNPWQAYQLLKDPYAYALQEHFIIVMLDAKGIVLQHEVISIGTLTETLVHPREVFYPAIRNKAVSLFLAHNHPSGDPEPSQEDLDITAQLCQVGKMMEINIVDHIILAGERFISLRQRGLTCFK